MTIDVERGQFRAWLKQQSQRRDEVGALSRTVTQVARRGFANRWGGPTSNEAAAWERWFNTLNASEPALNALAAAFAEWRREQ